MNYKTFLILPLLALTTGACADLSPLTQNLSAPLWSNTTQPSSPDAAFQVANMLTTLPGMPATSTLFFSRSPEVARLEDILALSEPFFTPYREHLKQASIQEHTVGLQLGQNWRQDHWELSWNWWVGVRERNLWIPQLHRRALREKLRQDSETGARITNLWNATTMHVGVGDVHITARYTLPLGELVSFSLGIHTSLPTATKQKQSDAEKADGSIPTDSQEFLQHMSKRARDIMLCAPFGSNGHTGIGLSGALRLNLGNNLKVMSEATSLRFRPGTQRRYALTGEKRLPELNLSEENSQKQDPVPAYLYPHAQEITLVPGAIHSGSVHLAYTTDDIHCSIGYLRQRFEAEESDTAPLRMLRTEVTEHQQLIGTASMNTHHGWGDTSSYMTAGYTFDGAGEGGWTLGFGATVQA